MKLTRTLAIGMNKLRAKRVPEAEHRHCEICALPSHGRADKAAVWHIVAPATGWPLYLCPHHAESRFRSAGRAEVYAQG